MRIGVLSGGGDAPGLNAVIRAVTKTAIFKYGWEVLGHHRRVRRPAHADQDAPAHVLEHPGHPVHGRHHPGHHEPRQPLRAQDHHGRQGDRRGHVLDGPEQHQRDRASTRSIVIGGDGSLKIGSGLQKLGVPVIGVPKTIDNDLMATHVTFGFQTAVDTATDALDKLHTTAESHQRVIVLEVMGRYAGWIALEAGIAGQRGRDPDPRDPLQHGEGGGAAAGAQEGGQQVEHRGGRRGRKAQGRGDGGAREGGRRVRAAAGRHGRDRRERDQQVHPDRDARHRARPSAARRQPLPLRPASWPRATAPRPWS